MSFLRPGRYVTERSALRPGKWVHFLCPTCYELFGFYRPGTARRSPGVVITTRCPHCQELNDYAPKTQARPPRMP